MMVLPIGLDRTISDTFGDDLFDAPGRPLTVRVALIRLLEVTKSPNTEATDLRLKLLHLPEGSEVETAEARLLCEVVAENARGYARLVTDSLHEYVEPISAELKAAKTPA